MEAIGKLHEINVRVVAEHIRPKPRQHSPPSEQPNKGPRYNQKKEIRTWVAKTQERTGITNKDNGQAEITWTTVDQTLLGASWR